MSDSDVRELYAAREVLLTALAGRVETDPGDTAVTLAERLARELELLRVEYDNVAAGRIRSAIATGLTQLGISYDPGAATSVLLDELVTEAMALQDAVRAAPVDRDGELVAATTQLYCLAIAKSVALAGMAHIDDLTNKAADVVATYRRERP